MWACTGRRVCGKLDATRPLQIRICLWFLGIEKARLCLAATELFSFLGFPRLLGPALSTIHYLTTQKSLDFLFCDPPRATFSESPRPNAARVQHFEGGRP